MENGEEGGVEDGEEDISADVRIESDSELRDLRNDEIEDARLKKLRLVRATSRVDTHIACV